MCEENEAKIEICMQQYVQTYGEIPNIVTMRENELANELMNEGLINSPQDIRSINSEDELKTKYGICVVHYITEEKNTIPILERQITFARRGLGGKLKNPKTFNMAMTIAGLVKEI